MSVWKKEWLKMKVSELISELENILKEYGDLDCVKGKDYVGSEEVTGVTIIRGHQCYIENKYLDNWSMKNIDKLEWVRNDLTEHLTGLSCCDCRYQKDGWCFWKETETTEDDLDVDCFVGKNTPYDFNYKINLLQNCIFKLQNELEQGNEY